MHRSVILRSLRSWRFLTQNCDVFRVARPSQPWRRKKWLGRSPPSQIDAILLLRYGYEKAIGVPIPDYRRNRVPGGTYFFTVNLRCRRSSLLIAEITHLRAAVREVKRIRPFHIDAWVVLPNHMHCLWTLPPNDDDFPARWQAIKIAFSASLPSEENRSSIQLRRRERGIWQRRYWEHTIRDEKDYAAHVDYIHFNPVKHGLVQEPAHWPFSSFHRAVAMGFYPEFWVGNDGALEETGERC